MVTEVHCGDQSRNSVDGAAGHCHGMVSNRIERSGEGKDTQYIAQQRNGVERHRHASEQFGKDGRRLARCGNGNAKKCNEKLRKSNVMEVNGPVA